MNRTVFFVIVVLMILWFLCIGRTLRQCAYELNASVFARLEVSQDRVEVHRRWMSGRDCGGDYAYRRGLINIRVSGLKLISLR
jgi:hypothetical protein